MPTWSIEYRTLLAEDRVQLYAELDLIRTDPMLTNCEFEDRTEAPLTVITASFLGFGPENPAVAELIRRKGILQLPVNIWMPLQVSRLAPDSNGRYNVNNPSPNGVSIHPRPDRIRGRTISSIIIDDMASFQQEFPILPGSLVGIDQATGRLVPNSEHPIGRVISDNLTLLSIPPFDMMTGVDFARDSDRSEFTMARRGFPEDADRGFMQEFMGEFPEERIPARTELTVLSADPPRALPIGFTVEERIGMGVVNPRAVERLQATRVTVPTFELQSNPQINIGDIRERRFDIIDRSVHSIQEEEDREILAALEGTFTNQPRPPMIPRPEVSTPEPVKETFIRRTRFERIIDNIDDLYPL
jgi:hypothetical protein